MKLMIATMIRGSRSSRSAVDQVVERRRERQQQRRLDADSQLLSAIVANWRRPSPLIVSVERPERRDPISLPAREHERQRREQERERDERARESAPERPEAGDRATHDDQGQPRDRRAPANAPTGSRLIARMNAIVATNLRRASARWSGLSRAT